MRISKISKIFKLSIELNFKKCPILSFDYNKKYNLTEKILKFNERLTTHSSKIFQKLLDKFFLF